VTPGRRRAGSYTAPGTAVRGLSVLAVGAPLATLGTTTGGREASEATLASTFTPVTGRPGLAAPPTRLGTAIIGRGGPIESQATGIGFASRSNILTARFNPLSGPNGRCGELLRAGLLGNRSACEGRLRR
jgi:hypothetical protein